MEPFLLVVKYLQSVILNLFQNHNACFFRLHFSLFPRLFRHTPAGKEEMDKTLYYVHEGFVV